MKRYQELYCIELFRHGLKHDPKLLGIEFEQNPRSKNFRN